MTSLSPAPAADTARPEPASAVAEVAPEAAPPCRDDAATRPVTMPLVDRLASAVVTAAPPVLLLVGMWFGWTGHMLVWQDILILALCYMAVGTGVTVGFHRMLTHRSFKCHRWLRFALAALGSAA